MGIPTLARAVDKNQSCSSRMEVVPHAAPAAGHAIPVAADPKAAEIPPIARDGAAPPAAPQSTPGARTPCLRPLGGREIPP